MAIDEQKIIKHGSAIAVPVFNRDNEEPAACIGVMRPSVKLTRARLEALAFRMREVNGAFRVPLVVRAYHSEKSAGRHLVTFDPKYRSRTPSSICSRDASMHQ